MILAYAAQLAFTRGALVRLVGVLDPVLELAVFLGKPLCHDVEPIYRTIVTRWPEVNCLPDREFVGHRWTALLDPSDPPPRSISPPGQ
jgi:hypothetical protein